MIPKSKVASEPGRRVNVTTTPTASRSIAATPVPADGALRCGRGVDAGEPMPAAWAGAGPKSTCGRSPEQRRAAQRGRRLDRKSGQVGRDQLQGTLLAESSCDPARFGGRTRRKRNPSGGYHPESLGIVGAAAEPPRRYAVIDQLPSPDRQPCRSGTLLV